MTQYCPCGSNNSYMDCCGRLLETSATASTAEELMRSRYTAFTKANVDYLVKTMVGPITQNFNEAETKAFAKRVKWLRLEILDSTCTNEKATVEFKAYYLEQGKLQCIQESSDFEYTNHQWFYIHGTHNEEHAVKVGRNDPCPCGSDKKYKKCCG